MTRPTLLPRIIKAVAAADGIEPEAVDTLHDYIDPEILYKLEAMENKAEWHFTFQFEDHQVTVRSNSQIFIDGELHQPEEVV